MLMRETARLARPPLAKRRDRAHESEESRQALLHHEIGLKGAGRLDRLKDRDDSARLDADAI